MTIRALPAVMLGLEGHAVATAGRTNHAVRPAAGDHVIVAVLGIGEVNDYFLENGGFGCAPYPHGIVKYISTKRPQSHFQALRILKESYAAPRNLPKLRASASKN